MTLATGERDTSVSALFSVSCVVRGVVFRLLVVVGFSIQYSVIAQPRFTYSPVNPLLGTWYLVVAYRGNGGIRRGIYQLQGDDNGHVGRPC